MGTLENKVALVTGAGQGIGRGIAYALAGEGAAIAVVGRTEAKLKTTAAEICHRGGRAVAFLSGPDAGYITGTTLVVDGGSQYLR